MKLTKAVTKIWNSKVSLNIETNRWKIAYVLLEFNNTFLNIMLDFCDLERITKRVALKSLIHTDLSHLERESIN